jgi:hypothetical protein
VKRSECATEPQILEAVRSGDAGPELLAHAQTCPACSEVWRVAKLLQAEPLAVHELGSLPDPGLIWRKAQARAREQALAKATLPIRLMRTCAIILAIFAAPWLLSHLTYVSGWFHELGVSSQFWPSQGLLRLNLIPPGWGNQNWANQTLANQSWPGQSWLDQNWLGAFSGATLLGISVTLACIAVGSWYMLREK